MKTHWAFLMCLPCSEITHFLTSIVAFELYERLTEIMSIVVRSVQRTLRTEYKQAVHRSRSVAPSEAYQKGLPARSS